MKNIIRKIQQFKKKGLLSYGKYLTNQLVQSSGSKLKQSYRKYIEDQIRMNNQKIKAIEL